MNMSNPQSIIYICSGVKLNPSYKDTIYFNTLTAQQNYFAGKVVKTFPAYSYLRKSWNIKVEATMEQAKSWTYLYFTNMEGGKVYYYFITNTEYVNDNTVELTLELDYMQTYHFDYTPLRCFVEREHSSIDNIGSNTIEENLDLGELTTLSDHKVDLTELCVLVMSAYNPMTTSETHTDKVYAANYNGIFSGLGIYAVDMNDWQGWGAKLDLLNTKLDGIVSMWMYPKKLVTLADGLSWTDAEVCKQVDSVSNFNESFTFPSALASGYQPRNKKLWCYPYNFLYVSNNQGGSATYKYERFINSKAEFKICGALSPEGAVNMYPLFYNGKTLNFEEGLTLGNFPLCAWNQDMYKLWLAQNQNTNSLALASGVGTMIAGVGTMVATSLSGIGSVAGAGMVMGGASQIANLLAQKKDMSVQPPQARGTHSASVNVVNGFQTFTVEKKCITKEYASIIDNYFDMYGYATRTVKVPNRYARKYWTYTQTVDCHIEGNINTEAQQKIESIYNNGITFWTSGDNIGKYELASGNTTF